MSRTKRTSRPHSFLDPKKATRDKKAWPKPPSWFKKMKAAQRKAKAKQALRNMKDPDELIVPAEPKTDQWEWT